MSFFGVGESIKAYYMVAQSDLTNPIKQNHKQAKMILYMSFAQAWAVILMELSIDYQGIDFARLVKLSE